MIRAVITFPLLLLGLYGMGEWLRARFFGSEPLSPGRIGRALGFGILAHALLMTVLGFLWLLRPSIAGIITAIPAVIFWKIWWCDLRLMVAGKRSPANPPLNVAEIVFLSLIIVLTLIRGFNSLAPNISWDATSDHYLVPSMWLASGRVSDIPSVIYSYYPSLTEMGIAGAMALGTDFLSNLYGWLFGVLAILLMIGIGMRHFDTDQVQGTGRINPGRFAGIAAAFLFTLFPGVGVQTSGGYVDLPLACWTLLAIDTILELRRRSAMPIVVAASLFAGAALSTKHLGALIAAGLVILLLWIFYGEKTPTEKRTRPGLLIVVFVAIGLLLPLPWYIRSTVLTGNPLYPFGIFGLPTPPLPPFTPSSWIRPDYHRSIVGLLTYWLYLVFAPSVGEALGRNYSVAILFAVPLVFLIRYLRSTERLLAILAGFSILVMYALFPVETRYHIPFIAVIALVFGLLVSKLLATERRIVHSIVFVIFAIVPLAVYSIVWHVTAGILLAIVPLIAMLPLLRPASRASTVSLLIFVVMVGAISFAFDARLDLAELGKRYKVVLNLEPEDRYLLRESPSNYGVIHHINREMDWREIWILALETRLYRLKADWVTWFGLKEPVVPTTPAENVAVWYRGGFTHILVGDDVALKALMYYNIVHQNGWDVPGATPAEMVTYLKEHPDEDTVRFRLEDLWTNFVGWPFDERSMYYTHYWLQRELTKELYPTEVIDGTKWYTASRLSILTDLERVSQYAFVRDFRELLNSGGLKVAYTDGLTFLFQTDYPAYLQSHPDVDLRSLELIQPDPTLQTRPLR